MPTHQITSRLPLPGNDNPISFNSQSNKALGNPKHPALLIIHDNGKIVWANDLVHQWFTIGDSLPETLKRSCLLDDHWLDSLNEAISKAQTYSLDVKLTCHDHEQQKTVRLVLEPLKSPKAHQANILACHLIDLERTRRLESALAESKNQTLQISEQASKVAHELNGPLDGTLRYLNLALEVLKQGRVEKAQTYLGHCLQGLHQMATVTYEMLNLARAYAPRTDHPVPVATIIQEAVQAIRIQVHRDTITVTERVQPDLPCIYRTCLLQVFGNLIKNAFDAMPNGGTLTIEAKQSDDHENLEVNFTDDGPGIAAQNSSHVFDPFFTTRPQGTGLGLTICRDLLMKIRGTVHLKESAGPGACIFITVPLKNIT